MFITTELLFQLPVETQDGTTLGHVVELEIDVDSQSILRYKVRPKGIAGILTQKELLISRGQIVSITKERILVDSTTLKETKSEANSNLKPAQESPSVSATTSMQSKR